MKKILNVLVLSSVVIGLLGCNFQSESKAQSRKAVDCNLAAGGLTVVLTKTHVIKVSDNGILTLFGTDAGDNPVSCTCDLKVSNGGASLGVYMKIQNKVLTVESAKVIAGSGQSKIVINDKPLQGGQTGNDVWIAGFEKYSTGDNLKFIGIEDVRGVQSVDSEDYEPAGHFYNLGISKAVGSNFWFVTPNQFWNETSVSQKRSHTPGVIYDTQYLAKQEIDKTFY